MIKKKLEDFAIVMNADLDNIAVAKKNILPACELEYEGKFIKINNLIKQGHRFALIDIKKANL